LNKLICHARRASVEKVAMTGSLRPPSECREQIRPTNTGYVILSITMGEPDQRHAIWSAESGVVEHIHVGGIPLSFHD